MNAVYYTVYSYHIHCHEGQVGKGFSSWCTWTKQNRPALYSFFDIYIYQGHHLFSPNIFKNMWSKNKPNCTSVYRGWSYPLCDYKSNQIFLTSEPRPMMMNGITVCRNMLDLVFLFLFRRKVVASLGNLSKSFSGFCPLRGGGVPPLSAKLFEHNDCPLGGGGTPQFREGKSPLKNSYFWP